MQKPQRPVPDDVKARVAGFPDVALRLAFRRHLGATPMPCGRTLRQGSRGGPEPASLRRDNLAQGSPALNARQARGRRQR